MRGLSARVHPLHHTAKSLVFRRRRRCWCAACRAARCCCWRHPGATAALLLLLLLLLLLQLLPLLLEVGFLALSGLAILFTLQGERNLVIRSCARAASGAPDAPAAPGARVAARRVRVGRVNHTRRVLLLLLLLLRGIVLRGDLLFLSIGGGGDLARFGGLGGRGGLACSSQLEIERAEVRIAHERIAIDLIQPSLEVIRGHQRSSEVIRGHPWPST